MKIIADNNNGVQIVDNLSECTMIFDNEQHFYDHLRINGGDEVIGCAFVSLGMAKKIKKEYGIH